jgi:hypothetical protein
MSAATLTVPPLSGTLIPPRCSLTLKPVKHWHKGSGHCPTHGLAWCEAKLRAVVDRTDTFALPVNGDYEVVSVPIMRDSRLTTNVRIEASPGLATADLANPSCRLTARTDLFDAELGYITPDCHRRDLQVLIYHYVLGMFGDVECSKCGWPAPVGFHDLRSNMPLALRVAHDIIYIESHGNCSSCDDNDLIPTPDFLK